MPKMHWYCILLRIFIFPKSSHLNLKKSKSQSCTVTQIPIDMRLKLERAGYSGHPPNDEIL
ncbi:UNVERIFIED_CONTAM: hypothetical protein NCL1_09812 [Trichonephila clavipes]